MKGEPIINNKRKCSKCKKVKPISEFQKETRRITGISAWCKDCGNKIGRERRLKRIEHYRKMEAISRKKNREKISEWHKNKRIETRKKVIQYYGGKCECCGEDRIEFLAIDHIKGGGNKHRKKFGSDLLYWIIRNNYPKGLRILCHNCNMSLGMYGYCPHQPNNSR